VRLGRAPVVLMLHGCGGRREFLNGIAEAALSVGAGAVSIDSHRPRGIDRLTAFATVCTGLQLQGRERAGDLYAAVAWAKTQSWIDDRRIIAAGWSHGGWTILDALALRSGSEMAEATNLSDLPREPLDGVAGAFVVYPYANYPCLVGRRDWRIGPRTRAIVCGRDYIVGDTRGALQRQRDRGAPIDISFFPDSTHAFEDYDSQDPRVRYDADATQREYELLRALIRSIS
jgi:dienelactone hydrolase